MMEWTDRHWRRFARCLTKRALLYTEMVTAQALIHGRIEQLIEHSDVEHPLALQIGGSNPQELHDAVMRVRDLGFCEINLNLGCPSDRVQAGCFGASLMADPVRVSECLHAMQTACGNSGPEVTAKIRLGINDQDIEKTLPEFILMLESSKIKRIIIHARIAILGGLSPKQNRDIPPLNYSLVNQIKAQFPHLAIVLNGGIQTVETGMDLCRNMDGMMMGRAAYQNPQELLKVDPLIFGQNPPHATAEEALLAYRPYVEEHLTKGFPLKHLSRHLVGLYHEVPGARRFRQILSEQAHLPEANWSVIEQALDAVREREKHA
jgi:tRNA-dihydrouridine synthase A